jgi:tight adherence protein C
MAVLAGIGLALAGLAIALLLRAVVLPRLRAEGQVQQIETYGFQSEEPSRLSKVRPGAGRLAALAERVGHTAIDRFGKLQPLEDRELLAAGIYEASVERVHGLRVMATVAVLAAGVSLAIANGSVSLLTILLLLVMTAIVWLLPASAIRARGQRRLDRIDGSLPELIDVLTATIEAGLGFAGSLAMCAERFEGPLGQELRLTLQEQTMGLSTNAALENMRERCDTPSVRAFVRAVEQGESLGVSIGAMMRNLASETRKRRRAKAEERIQKAPVKLLFPLIFLIFPALLIVLLFPAVYDVLKTLSGGG